MRLTFKKLMLIGLSGVLPFVLTGCLLKILFGFAVTSDIGEFVDLAIEGETNIALCFEEDVDGSTFVRCKYAFADGELTQTSTVELISEFGILGVFLDPIIVQVPDDAFNYNGEFNDGTGSGPQPLEITEATSFFADASTQVTPESGHKFIIVDFPSSVPPTITATDPLSGHPYSFRLAFSRLSFSSTELKAMYAGEVQINGDTFYPPLLPCTTDFSTIPAITIPFPSSSQDLSGQVLTALFSGDVAPCNNQVYDYTGITPPAEADLSITKSADPDPVVPGGLLVYTLTITNHGPDDATGVVVEDILPAEVTFDLGSSSASCLESGGLVTCNIGDVVAGNSVRVTVGVIVDSAAAGTITNIATVSSDVADSDPSNDSASADTGILSSNGPPDCSGAAPSIEIIWPPNHQFIPIEILGVTDPDSDPVSVTIDRIWQDEPVDTVGDGSFTPDGGGVGTDTAYVRAERVGSKTVPGNGRVYHIRFTADDGQGGTCSGEVLVGVPHDQGKGRTPLDNGALYDSTIP
jgi:uncharacterized repeat protein (TIGR01451 family)